MLALLEFCIIGILLIFWKQNIVSIAFTASSSEEGSIGIFEGIFKYQSTRFILLFVVAAASYVLTRKISSRFSRSVSLRRFHLVQFGIFNVIFLGMGTFCYLFLTLLDPWVSVF
jgi:hypothetical protein